MYVYTHMHPHPLMGGVGVHVCTRMYFKITRAREVEIIKMNPLKGGSNLGLLLKSRAN